MLSPSQTVNIELKTENMLVNDVAFLTSGVVFLLFLQVDAGKNVVKHPLYCLPNGWDLYHLLSFHLHKQ